MDSSINYALRRADDLIRSGKPEYAQPILLEFLRKNPGSEQGWLLLSLVMTERAKQIDSLQMVLRINPNNTIARSRLAQLKLELAPPPAPPPKKPEIQTPEKVTPPLPPEPEEAFSPEYASFQEAYNLFEESQDSHKNRKKSAPDPNKPFEKLSPERSLTGQPSSPYLEKVEQIAAQSSRHPEIATMVIGTGLVFLIVLVALITMAGLKNHQLASAYNTQVVFEVTYQSQLVLLPPTWTSTPSPVSTPTPTIKPTASPAPTATLADPAPAAAAQMALIQQQVSDLRSLEILDEVDQYLVNRSMAQEILTNELVNQGYEEELRSQAQVLTALGLMEPTYDLTNYVINGMADNLGGVYIPWHKQIFVLGLQFSGTEQYIYSHEYDHALVDQHYHIDEMGVYPHCLNNTQRCDAVQALVEGDASLLMNQWLKQYATTQDYQDILNYRPPTFLIPDQYSPPFVGMDVSFPYVYGSKFVQYLYDRGKWAKVNKAYAELPESTEQIIHPEKYLKNEAPIEVTDPPLSEVLSPDWRELQSDVFGEWMTYLILGYGADLAAQEEDAAAAKAAAGWGGDFYQAYTSESSAGLVLTAHWVWDSQTDAKEFNQSLADYLDRRFRGNKLDRIDSDCWQSSEQTTCLLEKASQTLWIIAPDEGLVEQIVPLYTGFTLAN
jgi:hypothetical protein